MIKKILLTGLFLSGLLFRGQAQLAITEVMSGENGSFPDWFELHNYGTNDIDLTGYSFNDDSHGGFAGADTGPFDGVTVGANETIVVTEQKGSVVDAPTFRTWWGLDSSVQVVVLTAGDPGLSANPLDAGFNRADSVRLWRTNLLALGSNTNGLDLDECPEYLVQRVDLGETVSQSLLYDTNSGTYDILSSDGVAGAYTDSSDGDIGSPGIAPSAIPATIAQIPKDQIAVVGNTVTMTNGGAGLPPLTFQWYFNGNPINSQTPGVFVQHLTAGADNDITNDISVLILTDVQTTNSGTYTVVASNGLKSFTNAAQLTVSATATPPSILSYTPALDQGFDAYIGQMVDFSVEVSGYPAPTSQWYKDNVAITDETNMDYSLALGDTNQTGTYSVLVTNTSGGTNLSFNLNVTPRPTLVVSEVMSGENTDTNGANHNDWFELSNLGDFPVNLYGYRIDDSHDDLGSSAMVDSTVIIHPSESVVFIQDMTPAEFRAWWGTNLPANVQIIDYNGSGQGLSGKGDEVHLWNAVAQTGDEIAFAGFGAGTDGNSFGFDLAYLDQSGFDGSLLTTNGINGAFTAAEDGDIGSPGTLVNMPLFVNSTPVAGGFDLSWVSQPNWKYTIQYRTNLLDSTWTTLTRVTSGDTNRWGYTDSTSDPQRFYRVFLNLNDQ